MAKSSSASYILTLPLKTEMWQENILEKRFEIGRKLYNACLGEYLKRYDKMKNDNVFNEATKQEKSKDKNKILNSIRVKYGLTEYSGHEFVKLMQHHFKQNIDAFTAQKIATRAWQAIEKFIFDPETKQVEFKRFGTINSLEGKTNGTGIRFIENRLVWNKIFIPAIIKPNDVYAHQTLQDKIKYCRIQRKLIRGKIKWYVQLVLEGIPPQKYYKETGEIKHPRIDGVVGIDIGTQTIAYASNDDVKLFELAPEVNRIDKDKRRLQRRLDRQRRANNPHKYNEDGTIKRNNEKWIKSKGYIKTRSELAELQRKLAVIRKQSHERLANRILSLGNNIKVEQMNYKGLQRRAKETTINEKTGRINKKKRFGKSLANKAPSMFLSILDRKLKYQNQELIKVNTFDIKASQYNHVTGEYTKKNLSERWNYFGDYKIQRDLYSAFLIMNVYNEKIDRDKCFETFDNFKVLHDIEIERLRSTRTIASMGI